MSDINIDSNLPEKQEKEIVIIKQDTRKDLIDLLEALDKNLGVHNPDFFKKFEKLITYKGNAIEVDNFREEFLTLVSEYSTKIKHSAVVPVEGTNSTDSILVNQNGVEANLNVEGFIPIDADSTDNTEVDLGTISDRIIAAARRANSMDVLDIYLYNLTPYALGTLVNAAASIGNSIAEGNIPDLFSAGIAIADLGNSMRYFSIGELAILGTASFYSLSKVKGITIKDMSFAPGTDFTVSTVQARNYPKDIYVSVLGIPIPLGTISWADILNRRDNFLTFTKQKLKLKGDLIIGDPNFNPEYYGLNKRHKDGGSDRWRVSTNRRLKKPQVMLGKHPSTGMDEIDTKAEAKNSEYKVYRHVKGAGGRWEKNKVDTDEGYVHYRGEEAIENSTFDDLGNLARQENFLKEGGELSKELAEVFYNIFYHEKGRKWDNNDFGELKKLELGIANSYAKQESLIGGEGRFLKHIINNWKHLLLLANDEYYTDTQMTGSEFSRDQFSRNIDLRELNVTNPGLKFNPTGDKGEDKDFSSLNDTLKNKTGVWQIGSIYVWPIDQTWLLKPDWIPFEFNPTIEESSRAARYAATQIVSRMGDLQSYIGTGSLSVTISTQYMPTSRKWSEVEQTGQSYDSWFSTFDLATIQHIEMAYRSLVMPYYKTPDKEGSSLYSKPPLIKVIIGDKNEVQDETGIALANAPFSNLLSYPQEVIAKGALESEKSIAGGAYRHFRTFVASSVQIVKNINEQPLFIEPKIKGSGKTPYLKDTFGFTVNLTLIEVTPSYMDIMPNFADYYSIARMA